MPARARTPRCACPAPARPFDPRTRQGLRLLGRPVRHRLRQRRHPPGRLRRRLAAIRPLRQPHQQRPGRLALRRRRLVRLAGNRLRLAALRRRSALADLVVEPKAQLLYSHYKAQDATLQGTRMQSGKRNAVTTRAGVRIYPKAAPVRRNRRSGRSRKPTGSTRPAPRPCAWRQHAEPAPSRNALELKARRARANPDAMCRSLGERAIGQLGSGGQRGYGGMLSVSYRW